MSLHDLITKYVNTLNKYGIKSKEATLIFEENKSNEEFLRIVKLAGWLIPDQKTEKDDKNEKALLPQ